MRVIVSQPTNSYSSKLNCEFHFYLHFYSLSSVTWPSSLGKKKKTLTFSFVVVQRTCDLVPDLNPP